MASLGGGSGRACRGGVGEENDLGFAGSASAVQVAQGIARSEGGQKAVQAVTLGLLIIPFKPVILSRGRPRGADPCGACGLKANGGWTPR